MTMAGGAAERNITFDEACSVLEEAIHKLSDNLEIEGLPSNKYFTSEEYIRLYTVVYNVACAKPPIPNGAKQLYDQYKRIFEDYISSKIHIQHQKYRENALKILSVLPSLRGKENENLLRELLKRWNNHKTMTRWLSRFLEILSRYYISKMGLLSLIQTSYLTFYNRVYGEIKDQVSNAIVSLMDREREGELIDQAMVKQVLDIFEEISEDALENYAKCIEKASFQVRAPFYSNKGLHSIATNSFEDYKLKVKECFKKEKTRVSEYLKLANKDKILEVYEEIKDQVNDAVFSLGMVKRVLDAFVEIREDDLESYEEDDEESDMDDYQENSEDAYGNYALDDEEPLGGTLGWFNPCEDDMRKVEKCFEKEKSRISQYLTLNKQEQSIQRWCNMNCSVYMLLEARKKERDAVAKFGGNYLFI